VVKEVGKLIRRSGLGKMEEERGKWNMKKI